MQIYWANFYWKAIARPENDIYAYIKIYTIQLLKQKLTKKEQKKYQNDLFFRIDRITV